MYITYCDFDKSSVLHIFAHLSSQILLYIDIFNINRKLLTQAFTWIQNILCPIIDKSTRELSVGILTLNFTYFSYFPSK